MKWKVKFRENCKICKGKLPKRHRNYCSKKCRGKEYYQRYKEYQREWQRQQRGTYAAWKKKCIICGKWYVQMGSHVTWTHKITAKDYRKMYDLPLKHGIVPKWYRELKGQIAKENKTYLNLLTSKSKRTRFRKNEKRAKIVTGWKGRRGSLGYPQDEYYG